VGVGEIVWLLTQSAQHKQAFFLGDLEWMAMPPILLQQFRLFYAKDRPIGVVLWAYVNDEVEARLLSGSARMRPQDWKCGDTLWVVDVIAPFGGTDEMLKDLKAKVFPDREVRFRAVEGGKGVARVT
jgi:cytolysin-activating lysine-acyltransferase